MGARLALVSLLALLPLASAAEIPLDADPVQECAGPPCGYILPYIDIVVDGKMACGGGRLVYSDGLPDDCEPIMLDGESRDYPAKLLWYWEMTEDGTYPKEAQQDIYIEFGSTSTNPDWLSVSVDGEGMVDGKYVIGDVDLVSPENMQVRDGPNGNKQVWFWYERDITITISRHGGPDADGLEDINDREGVQSFFVKAKSTDSGARFKESFTVEEFRWGTCDDPSIASRVEACGGVAALDAADDAEAPGVGFIGLLGVIAAVAVTRRRK